MPETSPIGIEPTIEDHRSQPTGATLKQPALVILTTTNAVSGQIGKATHMGRSRVSRILTARNRPSPAMRLPDECPAGRTRPRTARLIPLSGQGGLIVVSLAAGILGAGCASTSCAGVGFDSSVDVNFAALHRNHPGVLTVQLCVAGACSSSQFPKCSGTRPPRLDLSH